MKIPGRIDVLSLLPELHAKLIELLRELTPEEWNAPTVCKGWMARDIAAHLLDTDLRRLSICRDRAGLESSRSIQSYEGLVQFLNELNEDWVRVARRLSPRVLIDLEATIGPQVNEYWSSLDLEATAPFGVGWAGEANSANWFDCAREYTERWHHQQQIREAVGAPRLTERRWLHPVLATFVRALPVSYREIQAESGVSAVFEIEGEAGGIWSLLKEPAGWRLFEDRHPSPATIVRTDQDTAWRIFTKGISIEDASKKVVIHGRSELGSPFLGALAIMAIRSKHKPEP